MHVECIRTCMYSSGVQIVVIEPNSPAAMSQSIMRGDVIKFVDNKVTRSCILCRWLSLSPSFSVSRETRQPSIETMQA